MGSPRLRDASGRPIAVRLDVDERPDGIDRRHQVDRAVRQLVEIVELGHVDGLERQVAARQRLDSLRAVERGPFGAQRRDRVALATDLGAQLRDPFGLQGGIEFDLVDVGGGEHERGKNADMQNTQHQLRPMISSGVGSRGRASAGCGCAAALVRSAARSLAERARGLAASSASSGTTGRLVRIWKLGAARTLSGKCREGAAGLPRAARNVLTMRSSSEWNAIVTSRPPGASRRSAAPSASARLRSSSLTKMRKAWNVRVAGWMSPGRPRTTRPTIVASSEVVRIACRCRAAAIARATARAWRSSPSVAMIAASSGSEARARISAAL